MSKHEAFLNTQETDLRIVAWFESSENQFVEESAAEVVMLSQRVQTEESDETPDERDEEEDEEDRDPEVPPRVGIVTAQIVTTTIFFCCRTQVVVTVIPDHWSQQIHAYR